MRTAAISMCRLAFACLIVPSGNLIFAAAPTNDNFATATVLTGGFIQITGTNVDATSELGEPSHAAFPVAKSVWLTWTAPVDGSVSIAVAGNGFTPTVAVYTGSIVQALTPVVSNWGRLLS